MGEHLLPMTRTPHSVGRRRSPRIAAVVLLALAFAVVPARAADADHADRGRAAGDPTVIADWNATAMATVAADPTKLAPDVLIYTGFVQAAVYDAVVGIAGRYQPYVYHHRGPRHASTQAAAAQAAYQILVTYVPSQKATLDAALATSLDPIPAGRAKTQGVNYGTDVANNLIRLRRHDGRNAPIFFTKPPAPGVWRPTPPGFVPMLDPWYGAMTPMLVRSATQFQPPPPPALTSAEYTRDFDEVKAYGSVNSSARTAEQTATALFFSGSALVQYNTALRDQMTARHLDIVDTARMYAATNVSAVDALMTVWRAKLFYGLWRPITAITLADTDGNPATTADPSWLPLAVTPAYPEYSSGYNVLTAAYLGGLAKLFHTDRLNLNLTSTAVPGVVRHYDTGAAVRVDVVNARVWLGYHFRFADIASRDLGLRLIDWTTGHFFLPVDREESDG